MENGLHESVLQVILIKIFKKLLNIYTQHCLSFNLIAVAICLFSLALRVQSHMDYSINETALACFELKARAKFEGTEDGTHVERYVSISCLTLCSSTTS